MKVRKSTVAIVVVALVTTAAYVAAAILIVSKMFGAADDGDTPHTIAWGVAFLALTISSATSGRRTKATS